MVRRVALREARDVRRDQRAVVGDRGDQQRDPLLVAGLRVARRDAQVGVDLVQGPPMGARVLADVERGEVEAEHLHLADDVAQVGRGDEARSARQEGGLDEPQVGQQLFGVVVSALGARGRRSHPLAHVRERSPVGLLRVEAVEGLGQLGERRGSVGEDRCEARRVPGHPHGQRQAAGERLDAPFEEAQALLAHDVQRGHGGLRAHQRVAVAVAADPRAERQQRRHGDVLARVGLCERLLEVPIDPRDRLAQRGGEVQQAAAHLVDHGQLAGSDLVGAPQLLHRGQQLPAGLRDVRRGPLVEVAQDAEDAGELVDRRAPPGLGGVGGHDQAQLGAGQQGGDLGGAVAARGQLGDRLAQGAGAHRAARLGVAPPQPPHAFVVHGQVDELEQARERPHHDRRLVGVQARDHVGQPVGSGLVAVARGPRQLHRRIHQLDRPRAVAPRAQTSCRDIGEERGIAAEAVARGRGHRHIIARVGAPRLHPATGWLSTAHGRHAAGRFGRSTARR